MPGNQPDLKGKRRRRLQRLTVDVPLGTLLITYVVAPACFVESRWGHNLCGTGSSASGGSRRYPPMVTQTTSSSDLTAILLDLAPRRELPCGRVEIEVGDEQAALAVGLVREQRPVRASHRGSRGRSRDCGVDGREPARILRRAAEHGLLVEAVARVGEGRGTEGSRLGLVEVRVHDEPCAPPRRPPNGLGVAPALVANDDPERQRPDAEPTPPGPRRVGRVLGRVELHFVLEPSRTPSG